MGLGLLNKVITTGNDLLDFTSYVSLHFLSDTQVNILMTKLILPLKKLSLYHPLT